MRLKALLALFLCFFLAACNNEINSVLKTELSLTDEQAGKIQAHFGDREIDIFSICKTENILTQELDNEQYEAYDVISQDNITYTLIIKKDKSYCAILDQENNIIDGAIDDVMLPSWFAE